MSPKGLVRPRGWNIRDVVILGLIEYFQGILGAESGKKAV